MRDEPERQQAGIEDLVAVEVREGRLGGGNEEVVLFGVLVQVLPELRQVARGHERLLREHVGQVVLLEAGGYVPVDHPLGQCSVEARRRPAQDEEARTRHLHPAREVDPVERFPHLPVWARLEVELAEHPRRVDNHVLALVGPVRRSWIEDVGNLVERVLQRRFRLPELLLKTVQPVPQRPRRFDALGALLRVLRLADRLAGRVALGAQPLDLAD